MIASRHRLHFQPLVDLADFTGRLGGRLEDFEFCLKGHSGNQIVIGDIGLSAQRQAIGG